MATVFVLGLTGPMTAQAATAPDLGSLDTYAIVSSTFTNSNTALQTAIVGDVCYTTEPDTAPISITGTTTTSRACPAGAGTDQSGALTTLNAVGQDCTSLGAAVALNAVVIAGGTPGHFPPGCYSSSGAMDIVANTTVTLDGPGVYIFKPDGAITTGANSQVVLANNACADDVFWASTGAVTLGSVPLAVAPTLKGRVFAFMEKILGLVGISIPRAIADSAPAGFVGTIIQAAAVTLGHFTTLEGRILAFGGVVTTDANTITVPTTCAGSATLRVVKTVVGGTATSSNFMVHVKSGATDVFNSPLAGTTTPGTAYPLLSGTYVVSEDAVTNYVATFSDSCPAGVVNLVTTDVTCTITNTYSPPHLTVTKIVVNDGGGKKEVADFPLFINGVSVTSGVSSTTIIGLNTVSETADADYTSVISGDCAAGGTITLAANETKACTITNTHIPHGSIGSVGYTSTAPTVIVTSSSTPLINIAKVPSRLTTFPFGGGNVTYTYTVTNPGSVALNNVTVTDDRCSPVSRISGDLNANNQLDLSERWIYTCLANIPVTTLNIATAKGTANGLTATDYAFAVVQVAVPGLPNTGFAPGVSSGNFTRNLLEGSQGDDVKALQQFLNSHGSQVSTSGLGSPGNETNFFGQGTKTALVKWQIANNILPATGDFGPKSRSTIAKEGGESFSATALLATQVLATKNVVSTNQVRSGRPVRLLVPKLKVDTIIQGIGLTAGGAIDVPKGPKEVAWFNLGPRPGEIGSAVISGHYGWKDGIPAVFDNLKKLQPGDKILVKDEKGVTTTFVVREIRVFGEKEEAPTVFNSNDGKAHLNLVTCGGIWDKVQKSYSQRTVVFTDKVNSSGII